MLEEDVIFPLTHCVMEKKDHGKQFGSSRWMWGLRRASMSVSQSPALRTMKETFPSVGNSVAASEHLFEGSHSVEAFFFPSCPFQSLPLLPLLAHIPVTYYKVLQDSFFFVFCQERTIQDRFPYVLKISLTAF